MTKRYLSIQPVEAKQYNGNNLEDLKEFMGDYYIAYNELSIITINGPKIIKVGDWVIKHNHYNLEVVSDFFFKNKYKEDESKIKKPLIKSKHYNGRIPTYF